MRLPQTSGDADAASDDRRTFAAVNRLCNSPVGRSCTRQRESNRARSTNDLNTDLFSNSIRRYLLAKPSGDDFSPVDLDGPFPNINTTQPDINGALIERWKTLVNAENLTARQVIEKRLRSYELIADVFELGQHTCAVDHEASVLATV